MKKLTWLIAALMIYFMFITAGCNKENAGDINQNNKTSAELLNELGEFPITNEKVTLSIMIPSRPYVQDITTNEYTKLYEDKTNVHIDWDVVSGDYNQRKNIVLASGTYPDIFMGMQMTPSEQVLYGNNGALMPLNDLIEEHTINIKDLFKYDESIRPLITTPDGMIYGLPEIRENIRSWHSLQMWVYEPWLKKLSISLPNTTEEFYQMLKAFKEQDPNGNGIADEIPLAGIDEVGSNNIFPYIMNAFIYHGWERPLFIDDNGKIVFNADKDATREGYKYMNKLYDEGLLARDSFTMDRKQRIALGENPDHVILGTAPGMHVGMFTIRESELGRDYEYVTIPPLEGPDGLRATVLTKAHVMGNMFNISKDCKYPEVAMRWIDYFYSFQGSREGFYGLEGEGWRKAEEGEIDALGNQAMWKLLREGSLNPQNVHWDQIVPPVRRQDWIEVKGDDRHTNFLMTEVMEKYVPYGQDREVPFMYFTEEESTELAELESNIKSIVEQARVQFVVGAKDINSDRDWQAYLTELNRAGLEKFLQIYQEAYDKMAK